MDRFTLEVDFSDQFVRAVTETEALGEVDEESSWFHISAGRDGVLNSFVCTELVIGFGHGLFHFLFIDGFDEGYE